MKLSKHLRSTEIECRCGCGFGSKFGDISCQVVEDFELIRKMVSKYRNEDTPLTITSGCRCEEHNKAIGGAVQSRHLVCDALDIACPDMPYEAFYNICEAVIGNTGGIGRFNSETAIHIDTRGNKARWVY